MPLEGLRRPLNTCKMQQAFVRPFQGLSHVSNRQFKGLEKAFEGNHNIPQKLFDLSELLQGLM